MDLNTEEDGHSVLEIIANCLVLLLILVITRLNKMHLKYQPETAKSARGPKADTDSEDEDNRRDEGSVSENVHVEECNITVANPGPIQTDQITGTGPQTQVIDHVGVMQFGPNNKVITNNYTEPKQNSEKPPQDLQDKSDSSNNKTRKKHKKTQYQPETAKSARGPKDDTDSEDEDNKRGPRTQVIEHAEVMQFGPNNTVIINNYTLAKPQDKSAGGSKDGGGEDYRNADGGRLSGRAIDMLIAKKKSVGIIRGPGNLQGTGFLLKNHLVMTSYHLIKDIVSGDENEKCLNRQHTKHKKITIQFDYQHPANTTNMETYFYFTPDIQYCNLELDVAVLKLLQDSTNLPECFEHFSPFQRGMKAHMIGHPQGGILEVEANIEGFQISDELYKDAVAWSTAKYRENGYRGIQDSRKILFHCRFAHGTSGSPGCYTDPTKENAEVVWMLLEGYPGFYYKHLTPAEQIEVPKAYLIQQGITMEAIWRHMSKENRDLCLKIFGHRNEHFFPI